MPDTKISDLPLASAFNGSEYWVSSQAGVTVKMTTESVYKPISKTYAEIESLIIAQTLIYGAFYLVSDKDIILKATSTNSLSVFGIRNMRIVNSDRYIISGINKGVWNGSLSVSISDIVVWGGKCWENLTGSIGSYINNDDLDGTNWSEISSTDDDFYNTKSFLITYNFANDIVTLQIDDKGNEIIQSATGDIERTDWGNDNILNNKCYGIYNNSNDNLINNNRTTNTIYRNSNGDTITKNTNDGSIFDNSNSSSISFNSNFGSINGNSNSGVILFNRNNGNISGIGVANTDILYNINNGSITTTTTGSISDTTVNK